MNRYKISIHFLILLICYKTSEACFVSSSNRNSNAETTTQLIPIWPGDPTTTPFIDLILGPNGEILEVRAVNEDENETPRCGFSRRSRDFRNNAEVLSELELSGAAQEREYPWQVFITYTNKDATVVTCSGVVIDHQWVLSTASCIYAINHDADALTVYFDVLTLPLMPEGVSPNTFSAAVKQIYYHPRFDAAQFNYDFAMLKLVRDLSFKGFGVRPICLPATREVCEIACLSSDVANIKNVVVGWQVSAESLKQKRRKGFGLTDSRVKSVVGSTPPAPLPSFNVMAYRVLQKFSKPIRLTHENCLKAGFSSISLDNKTRHCIEVPNDLEQGLDSCSLHPGAALVAAINDRTNNITGIQFAICGLKSAENRQQRNVAKMAYRASVPDNNCIYSAAFQRKSVSLFSNICSVIDWINARYGYRRSTTTSSPTSSSTTKAPRNNQRDYYADLEITENYYDD